MSYDLEKAYDPSKYEQPIYERWESSGAFTPRENADKSSNPFTIIMPPPNANGRLHLGHMMFVLEDIMVRYQRMTGRPTLWLPGTDHAGIETQYVFERDVLAPEGKDRFDLGRERFFDAIWRYSQESKVGFLDQFKSLGFSADWSRLKYTMDSDIIDTVYDTFKRLDDDGLIYRGNRIVNWCPRCRAAFADIELDHPEREDVLYTLDYGSIRIATTRPETIFADVAVAVNPEDPEYRSLIGQTAIVPLIDRPVPIIADDHVQMDFGTRALKITPAHSKDDYEIGLRHDLPEISVIDLDGRMINLPEQYAGLTVDEARAAVVADLKTAGLLIETKPLSHAVAVHDRCGSVIEPLITEQWYVKVRPLIEPLITRIEADEITFVPERFKKIALDWLENEHDWNISRQIWWGIRIPVFFKASNDPDKAPYLVTASEAEAAAYYGESGYRAETDTFDTWFSSGQWPFATLMSTGDFDRFYPTSVMETGRDILTKWVTKMAMLGLYRTGKLPFETVYLHGMVTDEHGRKMSKSKGNGIDPLTMTSRYGTDALRLALTIGITPGNDGSLSERKIEGYRNYCNKLWNVARFILGQLPDGYSPVEPKLETAADRWIAAKTDQAITEVTKAIEEYRFSDAGQLVYSLLWEDFADWYVEASKISPNHDLLVHTLETILALAHPIAPFVTEAIWSEMPWHDTQLIVTPWPKSMRTNDEHAGDEFEAAKSVIQAARTLIAEEKLSQPILVTTDELLAGSAKLICKLGRIGEVKLVRQGSGFFLGTAVPTWIEATSEQVAARRHRLEADRGAKLDYAHSLQAKLANDRYVSSAPAAVVEQTRSMLVETRQLLERLDHQLADL